jgi:thiosulfate/3-mercaptopyruvate sulfurtransferase
MKKILSLMFASLLLLASPAWCGSYQYMSASEVQKKLADQAPLSLVDIQVEDDFSRHHISGALATYAYPVKSEQDRQKLAPLLSTLQSGQQPVVIICPRGKGGAKRTYDFLQSGGIAAERLFILEKGQAGWPYPELLAHN